MCRALRNTDACVWSPGNWMIALGFGLYIRIFFFLNPLGDSKAQLQLKDTAVDLV